MNELAKESWNYTLSENAAGDLVFSVVSGSVGLYDITICLSAAEIDQFAKEGKPYLARLANDIRNYEARYQSRKIA